MPLLARIAKRSAVPSLTAAVDATFPTLPLSDELMPPPVVLPPPVVFPPPLVLAESPELPVAVVWLSTAPASSEDPQAAPDEIIKIAAPVFKKLDFIIVAVNWFMMPPIYAKKCCPE